MPTFFEERRPHEGFTYDAYRRYWQQQLDQSRRGLDKHQRRQYHYRHYNWERSQRVEARYAPSPEMRFAMAGIDAPQLWMVLTETDCMDSAYSLPVIAAVARLSELVDLRILPRDANLDIMDRYLTGTARSIPKLVAFSEAGQELFQWGSRPSAIARLRQQLLEAEAPPQQITQALIEAYETMGASQVELDLMGCLAHLQPIGSRLRGAL